MSSRPGENVLSSPDSVHPVMQKTQAHPNPSITRPDTRRIVELGTIQVTGVVADAQTADNKLLFLPAARVPGMEPADAMLLSGSAAYPVDFS